MSQLSNTPTGYSANSYYKNSDFSKLIPPVQYVCWHVSNDDSSVAKIVTINNYNNSANYFVLTSFWYNYSGSSGTYSPSSTVTSLGQVVIYNKTSTSFTFKINKTTGDNLNNYLCFTIIYYG